MQQHSEYPVAGSPHSRRWNVGRRGEGGNMVDYKRLHLTMSCIRTASHSALSNENYVPKFGG